MHGRALGTDREIVLWRHLFELPGTSPATIPTHRPHWVRLEPCTADHTRQAVVAGLPFRCLAGFGTSPPPEVQSGAPVFSWRSSIVLAKPFDDPLLDDRVLPCRPLVLGMLGNTVAWASMLYVPFVLVPGVLAWHRRRRGNCPRCGYHMAAVETSRCPECGHER